MNMLYLVYYDAYMRKTEELDKSACMGFWINIICDCVDRADEVHEMCWPLLLFLFLLGLNRKVVYSFVSSVRSFPATSYLGRSRDLAFLV